MSKVFPLLHVECCLFESDPFPIIVSVDQLPCDNEQQSSWNHAKTRTPNCGVVEARSCHLSVGPRFHSFRQELLNLFQFERSEPIIEVGPSYVQDIVYLKISAVARCSSCKLLLQGYITQGPYSLDEALEALSRATDDELSMAKRICTEQGESPRPWE